MKPTIESLNILRSIAADVATFHHHTYILLDIAKQEFPDDQLINYLEIGCYAGASSCLMLQRPLTNIVSIDDGSAINRNIALNNMMRFNKYGNRVHHIQGFSSSHQTVAAVANIFGDKIDILLIDGGHTFRNICTDWMCYEHFVSVGGFCVFDDYNDKKTPEVHSAVDLIMETTFNWEAIGTLGNKLGAKGDIPEGNCFVARKIK